MTPTSAPTSLVGQDIRALRTSRQMTLADVAARMGRSVGWVSQIERDLSTPTMDDLRKLSTLFDVPLSIFFGKSEGPEEERGVVVRAGARREIGGGEGGLVETLISPDLTDDFEVIHSTFLPGAKLDHAISRPTTEVAYLMSGTLDLVIDGQSFTVTAGDSFRVRGSAYSWANPYPAPAIALWVISPPVY
ncbi:helix-turn-helix domain-containing protein [Albirhodobacter sp. R86504]|uniref:helix-turn-helix domain-containing protein n=1 Tax=Albirhodobacter sp. R86504 TaxID=3093848 RepID=UPI00367150AC